MQNIAAIGTVSWISVSVAPAEGAHVPALNPATVVAEPVHQLSRCSQPDGEEISYSKVQYSLGEPVSRIRPCRSWLRRSLGAAGDEQPDTIEDAGETEVEGLVLRTVPGG